jgi:DNA repair protein RadA/Sms
MSKVRTSFRCNDCGVSAVQWTGRCPSCGAWSTLEEERRSTSAPALSAPLSPAVRIADVDVTAWATRSTGVGELDRVLGGGVVPGSVTLVGGEPGIGKSTLLTHVAGHMAGAGATVLYVSAEESAVQVRARAERLAALVPGVWLAADTVLGDIVGHLDELTPDVVVVDSIQTVHDPELGSAPGSVVQVRECAHRLVQEAKARGTAVFLVGHVTKDGSLAGPRVLEHVVDTVLAFEGDRHHALRLLRATKHRFGSTAELGLFEMGDRGLLSVPDPSGLFLADRRGGLAGSVVFPALEGHRPLLVELQALAATSTLAMPRRSAQGLDAGRLAMLLAVLEKRACWALNTFDVFVLAVGGVKVIEPGADLALALALVSSVSDQPVPDDMVACAEIGLGGELRQAGQTARRLAEACRLGFRRAILPESAPEPPAGMVALRASTVSDAIDLAFAGQSALRTLPA